MSANAIETFSLGPLGTNSYLVHRDGEALAIDVCGDPAPIADFLAARGLRLLGILVTHQHFDHLYGVHALQEASGAPCFVPAGDAPIADTEAARGGIWGMPPVPAFESSPLPEGTMALGAFSFDILKTPGHTPGGVSFHFPEARSVFTGDSLFYRSMGRTDFPGGDHQTLMQSIRSTLFSLPAGTAAYPGHGPATTVGDERLNNPFIGEFAEA